MGRRPARTFEDLIVWQKAHVLALAIYRASARFPRLEETRYYLILARDLEYLDVSELMGQLVEVSKLLEGYVSALTSAGT